MGRYSKLKLFEKHNSFDEAFAMNCLRKVGMEKYYNKQISELSEGQKQRLFIARSLAQESVLYFLDEPFSGIDISTEKEIINIFKLMSIEGKTVVIIHHNLHSVSSYFNWLLLLNVNVIGSGPTKNIFNYDLLQKTYLGKLNILNFKKNK
jgi:manganese/zinc/iron transport system ATP- binding protein